MHFTASPLKSYLDFVTPVNEVVYKTAARLAKWDKRRFAEREVAGSNPGQTNTQGL